MGRNVNPGLEALRSQVRRDHKNVTNKFSRLRREGIEVGGTEYDPRRALSRIGKYNRTQLEAYSRVLRQTSSRTAHFMKTDSGVAGPDIVNPFLAAERKLNRVKRKSLADIADVKIPGSDETFKERLGLVDPKHRRMADPATDNPFKPSNRKGSKFTSPQKIKQLTEKMEREATPGHMASVRDKNRKTLEKMFSTLNMPKASSAIRGLNSKKFDVLFYDPKFMNSLGLQYSFTTADFSDDQQPFVDAAMQGAEQEILDMIGNLELVSMETPNKRGRGRPRKHGAINAPVDTVAPPSIEARVPPLTADRVVPKSRRR